MTDETDAKTRLFVITMVRLASMALIAVGLLILIGKMDMPREVGAVFTIFGLLELLLLPRFLLRKWKTPET